MHFVIGFIDILRYNLYLKGECGHDQTDIFNHSGCHTYRNVCNDACIRADKVWAWYDGFYYKFSKNYTDTGYVSNLSNANFVSSTVMQGSRARSGVQDGGLLVSYEGIKTDSCSGSAVRTASTQYAEGTRYCITDSFGQKHWFTVTNSVSASSSELSIIVQGDTVENRSFVYNPMPTSASHTNDPWVSSALIEYDQPYPSSNTAEMIQNTYPHHCLALCMNVTCNNRPLGGSTYSIAFPLQQIKFDIVKYYNNKNVENPEETPAIRTIDLYPNQDAARCGSYHCPGKASSGATCNAAQYYCDVEPFVTYDTTDTDLVESATCPSCKKLSDGSTSSACKCEKGVCNFVVFNHDGKESRGDVGIPFCTAWDGSYEIGGEFGKTNGDFAYRATVKTDVPGDNIITETITFDSTIAYPGMNQIPMQVDVTNIHTVRSTPSVVGNITAVSAQPL